MKPEHVLISFYASPNPVPGAAGRLRQTVGLSIISCIWDQWPNVLILQNAPVNTLYMVRSMTYC